MGTVAIGAPGHTGEAQTGDLAMEGVAEGPERFGVTGPALPHDFQLPGLLLNPLYLVSRMAIRADRSRKKPCRKLSAVDAFPVDGEDPSMAAPAGLGDVCLVNPGGRVLRRSDVMSAVAA